MHLVTFDDAVTHCRVDAHLTTHPPPGTPASLVVDLTIVADDEDGDPRACFDRLEDIVDDDDISAAILQEFPEAIAVRFHWAETRARVELVTLRDAVADVVDGDEWQCTVNVKWADGAATLRAGVPAEHLDTAKSLGSDHGMCAAWTVGDDRSCWLDSVDHVDVAAFIANAAPMALRARRAWLAIRERGIATVSGVFGRDELQRLTWPIAWSGTVAAVDRKAHEGRLRALRDDGLRALAEDLAAVAVVVEAGQVVGTVREVAP